MTSTVTFAPDQVLLLPGFHGRHQLVPGASDRQDCRLGRRQGGRFRAAPHVRSLPFGVREAQRVPQPAACAGERRCIGHLSYTDNYEQLLGDSRCGSSTT